MPRSRGGSGGRSAGRAPSRPSAPQRSGGVPQQQSRGASTAARPPAGSQQASGQQGQQGKQPGLFGQMASTAAGVAVGSSIGHAIGSMFGGGSGAAQQDQGDSAFTAQHDNSAQQNQTWGASACENDAKAFTRCMNEHQGNLQICNWYLDQLKACQTASSQY